MTDNQSFLQSTTSNAFTLGTSTTATSQLGKKKIQTAAEIAEKRRTEVFGDTNLGDSIKRGRTDYAETLRKKRR